MAKGQRTKKKQKRITAKPPEIVELEKAYHLVFNEGHWQAGGHLSTLGNSYSLDEKGDIIAFAIWDNKIKDVNPISILKKLEYLNLTRNIIEDISPIFPHKSLKYLYLGGNKIKDISTIVQAPNILQLTLWDNPIEDITYVKYLPDLKKLYCQNTKINDLNVILELKKLQELNANRNNISDINLLAFSNIQDCDLSENLIRIVSQEVAEKFNWLSGSMFNAYSEQIGLALFGNPLEFPPASVIELGTKTTKNYYTASEKFDHNPLSEGRIIFVGDGSSGKSSIIEKMLYSSFTKGREQTNGIHIEHLHLSHPEDNRDVAFHIWDFGGQEIQHAVHKFFFTEGCLYVLVLDNRKEEEPEYWLQQIESLGGKAPVLVVFNKQDENAAETADRKFLKEKYPNIVGFYKTSCSTGFGMDEFKQDLEKQVMKLRTVSEQFPNNWLAIKKAIEQRTTGSQHYLTYEVYQEICKKNETESEETQKLLLKYFNTIGAVTWFGQDTHLKFLHVLNPTWITQGVYKILTAKKTANLFGNINIGDFKELLQPISNVDYTYDEKHYGYILTMMKKFELCYTPDEIHILIPSAFGKEPKIEYSEFRGEGVRTYILMFKDYMPLALIHRYITKNLTLALNDNYWYTGIVHKDTSSNAVAMVHADKEARRIYVRIKGESKLGLWEHIRRQFAEITSSYAKIPYDELVSLDDTIDNFVNYDDLVSHIKAKKSVYFHPRLQKDYNVGYLMGFFETKEETINKVEKGEIRLSEGLPEKQEKSPPFVIQILNQNSPTVSTSVNTQVNVDIDIQVVNEVSSEVKGEAAYLLEELGTSNKELSEALKKVVQFTDDAKAARNSGDVKEKGWPRKLKSVLQTLGGAGEQIKNISDGSEALGKILHGVQALAQQFNMKDTIDFLKSIFAS